MEVEIMPVNTALQNRADELLYTVAHELQIPEDELLKQGLYTFLERRLRTIQADIFDICGRYGVTNVEAMETRYRDGTLEEADSWRDLQRLDHLEYKRDELLRILKPLQ